MHRAILAFLGLLLVVLACTPSAFAAKRVALVIGNDDYAQVPKLQKAVPLDEATRAAIREGLAQAERGEFVQDEVVAEADRAL